MFSRQDPVLQQSVFASVFRHGNSGGWVRRLQQFAYFVQNERRSEAFLQKGVNVETGIFGNVWNAGEHQNANVGLDPLHGCGYVITIAVGHGIVEENQINRGHGKELQPFLRCTGRGNGKSCLLQVQAPAPKGRFIIVDTQNAWAAHRTGTYRGGVYVGKPRQSRQL